MKSQTLISLLACASSALALWPIPTKYTLGNTTLWIERDVPVTVNIANSNSSASAPNYYNSPSKDTGVTTQIIQGAIKRTWKTILDDGYVPWKFHPRNADFEPDVKSGSSIKSIRIEVTKPDPENILKAADGQVDESYALKVTEDGAVTISGSTSIGVVRGLTTFTQLFYAHSDEEDRAYTPYAPVYIEDSPKFVHRGLNMDLSRHFFEVEHIIRTIDALAYSKMNRLHLHITDAQSWPLEIPALPELSAKGAYNKKLTYTPEDLEHIQRYGALQGVEVFLEIDMPGHTSSIWYSHPELIASFNKQPDWDTYAAEPPSGTLKLNDTRVYAFLDTLFEDLLPRVAPYTQYFHSGGDEVKAAAYINDETVRSNDSKIIQPLFQKFVDHAHKNIRDAGLTPIVWEETLLDWNVTLGSDVVVQSWQSDEAVQKIVAKGHKALVGNYNYWYLDCGHGQWLNFRPNTSASFFPYADYCSPRKNWRLVYSLDPHAGLLDAANATQRALVLGGEVHAWAEQIDATNIDRMLWPRAAAAAEVLWSGAKDPVTGANRSQTEAAPRLSDLRERLVKKGVMAEPIQMPFCTMGEDVCGL